MATESQRVMALDVGDARIGVAISDETLLIATPLTIIERLKGHAAAHVVELACKYNVSTVVIGLPKNMDGTIGMQARKAQRFAEQISRLAPDLQLAFWDERLSTREATDIRLRSGATKKTRRQPVDAVSAAVILQGYLDSLKLQQKPD